MKSIKIIQKSVISMFVFETKGVFVTTVFVMVDF